MKNASDALTLSMDHDGTTRFADSKISDLLGWTVDDLVAKPLLTTICPQVQAAFLERMVLGEAPILPAETPIDYRHRNGSLRTLLTSVEIKSEPGEDGQILLKVRVPENTDSSLSAIDGMKVLKQSPLPTIVHRIDGGRIEFANDKACELAGYSREELLCRGLRDLVPSLASARPATVLDEEGPITEIRRSDGEFIQVTLSTTRVVLEQRTLIQTILHEVPPRVTSGDTALRRAVDNLMDGFCILTPVRDSEESVQEFVVKLANPMAARILQVGRSQLVNSRLSDILPASTAMALVDLFSAVMETGHDANFQSLRVATDRGKATFALHAFKHEDGIIWTFRDETDRARAARMLALSEQRLNVLLSQLPVGVYFVNVSDPDDSHNIEDTTLQEVFSRQVITNRRAIEIFGDNNDLLGTNINIMPKLFYRTGEKLTPKLMPLRQVLENGQPYHSDQLELRDGNGKPTLLEIRGEPIRNQLGRVIALVAVINDVTTRVNLEIELARDQKMRAIGTLAGGIAHDFNNIAQTISGALELTSRTLSKNDDGAKDKAMEYVDAAQKAAERVSNLTRQLLNVSRQQMSAIEITDLGPLLRETLTLLNSSFEPHHAVQLNVQEGLWLAAIEAGQLQQCILNLALNARDSMSNGGKIHVKARNLTLSETSPILEAGHKPGDYVSLSVSDKGCGIPLEIMDRLFEPFFTTKGRASGSGLGLAVVYSNIHQLGGWVSAKSGPGGSTFTLILPRGARPEPREKNPSRITARVPNTEPSTIGKRVLVIDDDPDILAIVSEVLTELGLEIQTASRGEAGLNMLRNTANGEQRTDLVLLDLTMPGMSGTDVLLKIRGENLADSVVVMSGFASGIETRDLISLGASAFLPKPFPLGRMLDTVKEQLANH